MKRQFKLQKVLDYRILVLEKEKAKLAELIQQEQKILDRIQQTVNLIKLKQQELSMEEDFNLQEMYRKYITSLEQKRRTIQGELLEHRKLINQQKQKVSSSYKEKVVMDKLKEKHDRDYKAYIDRQERLIVEDIVITRKAIEMSNTEEPNG